MDRIGKGTGMSGTGPDSPSVDCRPGNSSRRIVVYSGNGVPASTTETIEAVAESHPDWQILVVQGPGRPESLRRYLRGKLRRLLREPISYPLEIISESARKLRIPHRRFIGGSVALPPLSRLNNDNVSHYQAQCIHSEGALSVVRQFQPWLGLSLAAPILRPCLFQIPTLGTINVHKSYLPNYRGMPPGFWELHDRVDHTGVSIHWMEPGLDTGDIVDQVRVGIPRFPHPGGLGPVLDAVAIPLLLSVLDRLDAGEVPRRHQPDPETPTRSRPPFLLRQRVAKRFAARRRPTRTVHGRVRNLAKGCLQLLYVHSWAPIRNFAACLAGKAHVTVLLYHRVDDDLLDDVTIGVDQFREQLRLLKRHYDILDLTDFLAARGKPRRRPAVVVTFDDGYESAFVGAKLLRREGIPATFFLSTGIVGSDKPFPHDVEKLGRRVPSLSWPQVADMRKWGFQISGHTVTHANVGRLPLDEAKREIGIAVQDLVARFGHAEAQTWFAYPHGKRQDITDEVRNALPSLGIQHCLSAYGGTNSPDFDPMDIKRQGVDWKYSLLGLRAVVEGWQVR